MKHILALLVGLSLLVSCRTVYIPVTEYRDSLIVQTKYDSIRFVERDSIYIKEKKDTVFVERWKTIIKERFKERVDTIKVVETKEIPYPVEKIVQGKLSKWHRTQIGAFWLCIAVGLVYVAVKFKTPLKGLILALKKIFMG